MKPCVPRHSPLFLGRGSALRGKNVPAAAKVPACREPAPTPYPSPMADRFRPEQIHAALGPAFYDPVRPAAFPETRPALPQRPLGGARRPRRPRRRRVGRPLRPLRAAARRLPRAAGAALPRPPVPGVQPRPRRRPGLSLRAGPRPRRRPAARPRHQGLGHHALVARRRRPADAEGRGARDPRDRDARGARASTPRRPSRSIETGEALERGDEPSPTRVVGAGAAFALATSASAASSGSPRSARPRRCAASSSIRSRTTGPTRPPTPIRSPPSSTPWSAPSRALGAEWFAAGFVHGVLNTDNISITGESFDYGPWRFLDRYDPGFTAAYFDQTGLYAFARQPEALNWNLARLGECLIPLSSRAAIEAPFEAFADRFQAALTRQTFARLGLLPGDDPAAARALMHRFWGAMQQAPRRSSRCSTTCSAPARPTGCAPARCARSTRPRPGPRSSTTCGPCRGPPAPSRGRGSARDHGDRRGRGDLVRDRRARRLGAARRQDRARPRRRRPSTARSGCSPGRTPARGTSRWHRTSALGGLYRRAVALLAAERGLGDGADAAAGVADGRRAARRADPLRAGRRRAGPRPRRLRHHRRSGRRSASSASLAGAVVAIAADRLAHRRRLAAMSQAFERAITMPVSLACRERHRRRGAHDPRRDRRALQRTGSAALREQLTAVVGIVLLIPTAIRHRPADGGDPRRCSASSMWR